MEESEIFCEGFCQHVATCESASFGAYYRHLGRGSQFKPGERINVLQEYEAGAFASQVYAAQKILTEAERVAVFDVDRT